MDEARLITNYIQSNRLNNYIVMGDFNAHSPLDAEVLEANTELKKRLLIQKANNAKCANLRTLDRYDFSVLSHFYSEGLVDIVAHFVPAKERMTYPTAYLHHSQPDDPQLLLSRERLDYFLVSENLAPLCEKATVHNGADAEGISDHYPVSLILRLP